MKKFIFFAAAIAAMVAASSCKQDLTPKVSMPELPKAVSFNIVSDATTRAAIDGTVFPDARQMAVSAYENVSALSGSSVSKDYFEDITFSKDGSVWKEHKYWPLASNLDFLAFSFEGYSSVAHPQTAANGITPSSVTWGADGNVAKQVVIVVPDNGKEQDDILFGAANAQTYIASGNPMQFKHANTLVGFVAKTNVAYDATNNYGITIDRISIDGAYHSGTLTISNPAAGAGSGELSAAWSALGSQKAKGAYYVQSIEGYNVPADFIDISAAGNHFGINSVANNGSTLGSTFDGTSGTGKARNSGAILPEQTECPFTIEYTIHNGFRADGTTPLDNTMEYTYTNASPITWLMGKKYIYAIDLELDEITIAPTVLDWTLGEQRNIVISQ